MTAHVRPFPSRAAAGNALWCPAREHVGPRMWRVGFTHMLEAVCPDCEEKREAAAAAPPWYREVAGWVLVLVAIIYAIALALYLEPPVSPGEGISEPPLELGLATTTTADDCSWPLPAEPGLR